MSECECNVIREGVAVVVRSFQNSCFFFSAFGPLTLKLKRLRFNLSQVKVSVQMLRCLRSLRQCVYMCVYVCVCNPAHPRAPITQRVAL